MDPNFHRPMALQETPVILPGHDFETVTETIAEIPLSKRYPLGWIVSLPRHSACSACCTWRSATW
jgi:hypothetical protein